MTVETFPDVEGAFRTWLRTKTAITAIVGQRVFFGVPKKAPENSFPMLTVQRVGGGDDSSDAALDVAVLQFDCWGGIDASGNGKKAEATVLVNAVRSALHSVNGRTEIATGVFVFGVNVESNIWLPDPDNDRPRYAITAEAIALSS